MAFRKGDAPFNVEVVVAAGSIQTDAAVIPTKASPALIVAAGDNTVGLVLPPAVKGKFYIVKNTGTGGLKVYPASGDGINAIAPDSPITMATVTSAIFIARNSSTWYTVPLLPS